MTRSINAPPRADARWTDWESIANQPIGNIPGMTQIIRQYMQSIILPTMS